MERKLEKTKRTVNSKEKNIVYNFYSEKGEREKGRLTVAAEHE